MASSRSIFSPESTAPRSDIYTGLLAISLGALITGCLFLYLDWAQYGAKKPPESAPAVSQIKSQHAQPK